MMTRKTSHLLSAGKGLCVSLMNKHSVTMQLQLPLFYVSFATLVDTEFPLSFTCMVCQTNYICKTASYVKHEMHKVNTA